MHSSLENKYYDVVIIGAGPVGLLAANLLGQYGVKTLILEKEKAPYSYPRAIGIDDEALRALQYIGFSQQELADLCVVPTVEYFAQNSYRSFTPDQENKIFGYPLLSTFLQYELELQLRQKLQRYPCVDFKQEQSFVDYHAEEESITILSDGQYGPATIHAKFLLACDGGKSNVRKRAGIQWLGDSQAEKWLVVDLHDSETIRAKIASSRENFVGNSAVVTINLPKNLRRFEIKLLDQSHAGDLDEETTAELLTFFLKDISLNIIRSRVYGRYYRIAEFFDKEHIFLLGDAAHLVPPYGGQGLCSGIRDAINLCWKIALQNKIKNASTLLASYQQERYFHMCNTMDFVKSLSSNVEKKNQSIRGEITTEQYRKIKLTPYFEQGFLTDTPFAGQMLPQPKVCGIKDQQALLDDFLGQYFTIIAVNIDINKALADAGISLDTAWCKTLSLYTKDEKVSDAAVTLIEKNDFFSSQQFDVLIVRPDRFIYATCFLSHFADTVKQVQEVFSGK